MKKLSLIFFIFIFFSSSAFAINVGKDAGIVNKGFRVGGNTGFSFGKQAVNNAIYWRTARTDFWNYARTGLWNVARNAPLATLTHLVYDDNDATSGIVPNPIIYESGSTATVLDNTDLTKTNFTFSGWNTAADGSGTDYLPASTFAISADTTLYAQWLEEFVIDLGEIHIAIKNGEAMFFHDSIDFSDYAGTDAGSTPYIAEFEDSAGKKATAYLGAVGGGETLGSELSTAFTSGWLTTANASITDADTFVTTASGYGILKNTIGSSGSIYKCVISGPSNCVPYMSSVNPRSAFLANGTEYLTYVTSLFGDTNFYLRNTLAGTSDVTALSLKIMTNVPATGLHLMSTKNGTTRNMASVETGFNPNAIIGVTIWTP